MVSKPFVPIPASLITSNTSPSLPSIALSPLLTGNFGNKPGPAITSITAGDPSGTANPGFTAGDTITVKFAESTNRPLAATTSDLNALFTFSESIGNSYTGTWTSASILTITIVDAGSANPNIGSATFTVKSSANLKNAAGTSLASTATSPALVGNFGQKAGPAITSLTAADPDNSDSIFSDGDTITVRFSEDTNRIGFAVGATMTKANLDSLFTFTQEIGDDYTGVWTDDSTLVISIVDSGSDNPPEIDGLRIIVKTSASLQNLLGTSLSSDSISPFLSGSFGTFTEIIPIGDGGNGYTVLPSGITSSIELPGGTSGVMTFERVDAGAASAVFGILGDTVDHHH